jgi:hypothetical protein
MLSHIGLILNICWCWEHSCDVEVLVLSMSLVASLFYHFEKVRTHMPAHIY